MMMSDHASDPLGNWRCSSLCKGRNPETVQLVVWVFGKSFFSKKLKHHPLLKAYRNITEEASISSPDRIVF